MTKTATKKPRKTPAEKVVKAPVELVFKVDEDRIQSIPLDKIVSNEKNPRKSVPTLVDLGYGIFSPLEGSDRASLVSLGLSANPDDKKEFTKLIEQFEPDIVSLASSMQKRGQLQPARVRPRDDGNYDLVFGCRRLLSWMYLACQNGQQTFLRCTVATVGDDEAAYQAFDENTCRRPMNPIEQAEWIRSLTENGLNKEQIKAETSLDGQVQRQRLLLLKLDQKRQDEVASGELGVVKALQIVQGRAGSGGSRTGTQKGGKPGGKSGERRKSPTLGEFQEMYETREDLHEKVREFLATEILQIEYMTYAKLKKEKEKVAASEAALENGK